MGAGTLVIQSASETGRNEFSFIRHPEEVQREIYQASEVDQHQTMRTAAAAAAAQPQAPSTPPAPFRADPAGARHARREPRGSQRDHRARAPGRPARPRGLDGGGVPGAEGEDPGPAVIGPLDHVYYWVRDMDAAVAFYGDVLDLTLLRRDGNEWAEFDAGPVRLALHGSERAGGGWRHGGLPRRGPRGRSLAARVPRRSVRRSRGRGPRLRAVRHLPRSRRQRAATDRVRRRLILSVTVPSRRPPMLAR